MGGKVCCADCPRHALWEAAPWRSQREVNVADGRTVGREVILDGQGASNGITGVLKGGRGGQRGVL